MQAKSLIASVATANKKTLGVGRGEPKVQGKQLTRSNSYSYSYLPTI